MLRADTRLSDAILARYGGFVYGIAEGAQLLLLQLPVEAPIPAPAVIPTEQILQKMEYCLEQNAFLNFNINVSLAVLRRLLSAGPTLGPAVRQQSKYQLPGRLLNRPGRPTEAARQEMVCPRMLPVPERAHPAFLTALVPAPLLRASFTRSVRLTAREPFAGSVGSGYAMPAARRAESAPPVFVTDAPPVAAEGYGWERGVDGRFYPQRGFSTAAGPRRTAVTAPLNPTLTRPFLKIHPVQAALVRPFTATAPQTRRSSNLPARPPAVPPLAAARRLKNAALSGIPAASALPARAALLRASPGAAPETGRDSSEKTDVSMGTRGDIPGGPPKAQRTPPPVWAKPAERFPVPARTAQGQPPPEIQTFSRRTFSKKAALPAQIESKDASGGSERRASPQTPVDEGRRPDSAASAVWSAPPAHEARFPALNTRLAASMPALPPPFQERKPPVQERGLPSPERAYRPPPDAPDTPAKPGVPPMVARARRTEGRAASAPELSVPMVETKPQLNRYAGLPRSAPSTGMESVLIFSTAQRPPGRTPLPSPLPSPLPLPLPPPDLTATAERAHAVRGAARQTEPLGFAPAPILLRAGVFRPSEESGDAAEIPTVRTRRSGTQTAQRTEINRAVNAPGTGLTGTTGQDLNRAVEEAVRNLDIKKLTERVYRDLETRLRSEQARRGKW